MFPFDRYGRGVGRGMAFRAFDRFLLAGLALLVFELAGLVLTIPLHVPLNYNENWNALWETGAVVPGAPPLYPPADTFVFDNDPPLGFVINGALGRFLFKLPEKSELARDRRAELPPRGQAQPLRHLRGRPRLLHPQRRPCPRRLRPIMSMFPGRYRVVFHGPAGTVLLAPIPSGAAG